MTVTERRTKGAIGESTLRPDGIPKLVGNYAYASDLYHDNMLWGATLRSPYAHARLVRLDTTKALAMAGVVAVLTQEDVPGRPKFGMEQQDQPVFCDGVAMFWGEPVAVVAADDEDTARRAVAAIEVEWKELTPLVDAEEADRIDSVFRRMTIERGDPAASGAVVVEGFYEVGSQDQAPLGPEAGLAIPDGEGGVDLWAVSQWTHVDHEQIYPCLGLEPEQVRCHPVGMGGAFGSREDMSLHLHACMLALRTGRPVKMVYDRSESFVGHVHRHPAKLWYRHEAAEDGALVKVEAKVLIDGGAYASSTTAVIANAAYFAVGPYNVANVAIEGIAVRTNNPPAGAMRGFGNVQSCFAAEAQMDRLAAELGLEPLELRRRNALESGDLMPTSGQRIETSLPTLACIDQLAAIPLPPERASDDPLHMPGGTGLTTGDGDVRRGVGYALSIKNLAFSEAFDDFAEARVILTPAGAEVHTAAVEVGQGLIMVCQQIARTVLGIEHVAVVWDDTSQIGSAGSTSASRQTMMAGNAVKEAAEGLRAKVLEAHGGDELSDDGVLRDGTVVATLDDVCAGGPVEHHVRYRHPETFRTDEKGQGRPHADFAVAAHRAVVDVDPELGLVRVVQVDTAQDVGRIINPLAAQGQVEGGIMQGVGLAVMEELVIDEGRIRNANFTDYLLPTTLDAPDVEMRFIEEPSAWGPFGAKGIGEPPTISSTPAVAAAIRHAVGRHLHRVPIRPQDIVGL